MATEKPRKLNGEYAIVKRPLGCKIYGYVEDSPDLQPDPYAGSVVLDEDAMMEVADAICSHSGGCDWLKDAKTELGQIKERTEALIEAAEAFEACTNAELIVPEGDYWLFVSGKKLLALREALAALKSAE